MRRSSWIHHLPFVEAPISLAKTWTQGCLLASVLLVGLLFPAPLYAQHPPIPAKIAIDSIMLMQYYHDFDDAEIDRELRSAQSPARFWALLMLKGVLLADADDLDEADRYALEALRLAPAPNKDFHRGLVSNFQAYLDFLRGDHDQAIYHYLEADSLYDQAGELRMRARNLIDMAEVQRQGGNTALSHKLVVQAEDMGKSHAEIVLLARITRVSLIQQLHESDRDTSYLQHVQGLMDTILEMPIIRDYPLMQALVWSESGVLQKKRGHFARARNSFEHSEALFRTAGDLRNSCSERVHLFWIAVLEGNMELAIQYGQAQLDTNALYHFTARDPEIYSQLVEIFARRGDYHQAFQYQKRWMEFQNKADELAKRDAIYEIEQRYEAGKKETALRVAASQNRFIQKENQTQKTQIAIWRWVVAAFALLLLGLLALALRLRSSSRRIHAQAQQLQHKNALISSTLNEREFLLKELHHRVKNNLQLLMSFMNLHQRYNHAEPVPIFVATINKKIAAMALVHEQLHRGTEVGHIKLQEYLREVTANLLGSFSGEQEEIELEIVGPEFELDLEQAIPLGLIVNEIVTNSLKYAFAETDPAPRIRLEFGIKAGDRSISVRDNGRGFPPDYDPKTSKRIGSKIILLLARQIGLTANCYNADGAVWEFAMREE